MASLTSAVTALRTDIEAQDGCIQALEAQAQATQHQASATDTALTRQGNMLLALRRQVEDLDNRSRRSNIRVRGVPERERTENVEEMMTELFNQILWSDTLPDIRLSGHTGHYDPGLGKGTTVTLFAAYTNFPLKNA
ncbi:Hypothetical predicted protein [Pelobates cultripes]|uniref:Uncharacterized protein n=1 Tax=Pelobates cultripes TaxID=61616 RepID=A0AAD1SVK1_PELCU|nr:Hypothetical predicted protein [Pelobates cultripes]